VTPEEKLREGASWGNQEVGGGNKLCKVSIAGETKIEKASVEKADEGDEKEEYVEEVEVNAEDEGEDGEWEEDECEEDEGEEDEGEEDAGDKTQDLVGRFLTPCKRGRPRKKDYSPSEESNVRCVYVACVRVMCGEGGDG
jgi:TATA-binding protein-associated factor Taf7